MTRPKAHGDAGERSEEPPRVMSEVRSSVGESMDLPTVSVVVSTRDRAPFLGDLFRALESQTLGRELFEVIVVDDGSRDGTWERLVEIAESSPLRYLALRLDRSLGQGTGRNIGIQEARGEIIALTDDDCIPAAAWLEQLTSQFFGDTTTGHTRMVVQGRTEPWSGDIVGAGPWDRTLWVLGPTWRFETCNIAYRRVDLANAGGFPRRDEVPTASSGKLVGEDALLGWRVIEQGAELVFNRDAVAYHRHLPGSYKSWVLERRGTAAFPALMKLSPLARRGLWARWFLAQRTAAFDLTLVGVLLTVLTRRPWWLAAAVPWARMALPEARYRGGRHPAVRLAQLAIGDLVSFSCLAVASARSRSVVL